jgi:hypothetical protein
LEQELQPFHNTVGSVASLELLHLEEGWYMLPVDWQHEVDTGMRVEKGTFVDGVEEEESLCGDDDLEDCQSADGDGGEDADLERQSCTD